MNFEEKENSYDSKHILLDIDQSLNSFRNQAKISLDAKITIIGKSSEPDGSKKLNITYTGEQPIKVTDLDHEVLVSTPFTAEIYLDKGNNLIKYNIHSLQIAIIDALKEELNNKLKDGLIFFPKDNEKVSISKLFAEKKPFYILKDDQGKQHLKRAYIE